MRDLIIFGLPGSGKGTQGRLVSQKYAAELISTGDLLRSVSSSNSAYSNIVSSYIRDGRLVDDELVCKIVEEKISSLGSNIKIVFDGFPRSLSQASFLSSQNRDIGLVIELVVDENSVIRRLGGRLLCSNCLMVSNYNLAEFDGSCQVCGSKNLVMRNDDSDSIVIRRRIDEYHLQSSVLSEYYKSKMVRINGSRSIEEVWADVQNKIDLCV